MNKSPFLLSVQEIRESNKKYKKGNLLTFKNEFSPLSGYEKKYEPSKWNDNIRIKQNHNCYAYVLNQIVSNRDGKPQPGYFSNFPPLKTSDYNCYTFYNRYNLYLYVKIKYINSIWKSRCYKVIS